MVFARRIVEEWHRPFRTQGSTRWQLRIGRLRLGRVIGVLDCLLRLWGFEWRVCRAWVKQLVLMRRDFFTEQHLLFQPMRLNACRMFAWQVRFRFRWSWDRSDFLESFLLGIRFDRPCWRRVLEHSKYLESSCQMLLCCRFLPWRFQGKLQLMLERLLLTHQGMIFQVAFDWLIWLKYESDCS